MNSNIFTIQSSILCKDWFLKYGIKHSSNTLLSLVWLFMNQSLFHRKWKKGWGNFGLPFLSLVFRKLGKVVCSENSSRILLPSAHMTKFWPKMVNPLTKAAGIAEYNFSRQLKYRHLGVLGFHDGKLCQMILLCVAHSNY